ncbi:Abhydrolase_6 domain-containing protein [Cephalotus follicularis]|uniref:Abhydrolase_6 domain-containing protein n=1 Tax=Cephalotus follicularis TaxID=3775 RepID=A0A1Q3D0K6_CEPFO|nr:Abhydrolase_6 domain-containing protein [Cephalotus follicularis]
MMLKKNIAVILLIGLLGCAYQGIRQPPSKKCGSPGGPPITAPRIKLRDGRHLAFKEHGVAKEIAKFKVIFVHGFASWRHDETIVTYLSQEVVEELGVYSVSFDKPGYGESDPDPKRTIKSLAFDMEELADQLGLGSKFYVVGYSMGGQAVWGCLKYIPHRLAGAALLAPVVNYWWPGFPSNLSKEAYNEQLPQDQWALRVVHYIPWLTSWWNTQKLFPAASVVARRPEIFSRQDRQLLPKVAARQQLKSQILQQGVFESIFRDMMVGFGSWEFDPMDLENPFPSNEGSVHLWQGDEDALVPVNLQRHIAKRLPWIYYHELPGAGHLFPIADGISEVVVKALLHKDQ